MKTLSVVGRKQRQSTYAVLQKSLQQEWAFVQQVTPGIGDAFGPTEQALRETFIPDPFQGLVGGTPGIGVTCLLMKQTVLSLPDPTKTAPKNWMVSCVVTGHLVVALRGQ